MHMPKLLGFGLVSLRRALNGEGIGRVRTLVDKQKRNREKTVKDKVLGVLLVYPRGHRGGRGGGLVLSFCFVRPRGGDMIP